jgi:hypothetical protein
MTQLILADSKPALVSTADSTPNPDSKNFYLISEIGDVDFIWAYAP